MICWHRAAGMSLHIAFAALQRKLSTQATSIRNGARASQAAGALAQDTGHLVSSQHAHELALLRQKLVALHRRETLWHAERDRLLDALQTTVRLLYAILMYCCAATLVYHHGSTWRTAHLLRQ
jgi:hypothetical protein